MATAEKQSQANLEAKSASLSLTTSDLQKSIRFYTEGLGFEIDRTGNDDSGQMRFAMVKAGNAYVGLGQDDFAKGRDRVKGVGMRFWISTSQDLHEIAARAKANGITLDSEPEKTPWGTMAFSLTDPDGFKITITNDLG
jgi:catechol 2,3-dioxygenase-like lactoylglutathione lyase family enzyme